MNSSYKRKSLKTITLNFSRIKCGKCDKENIKF